MIIYKSIESFFFSCATRGFKQTRLIVANRLQKYSFAKRMRKSALHGLAGHAWQSIEKKYVVKWNVCWRAMLSQRIAYFDDLFKNVSNDTINGLCARYVADQFCALGSDWYDLDDTMWHTDIRLKQRKGQDILFDNHMFYADIEIKSGDTFQETKDVKVPWELSRLQHLPLFACAYQRTHDQVYVEAFVRHVKHWQKHNLYLLGINWVCPMEVALRAISLIISFDIFKHAYQEEHFWQSYVAMLYDHMIYLEHNWEWYDGRTSNHYLSDLVGYLYLCYFFKPLFDVSDKIVWSKQQLQEEVQKQIADDGTSYEGSTRYHLLVTELCYHAWLMSDLLYYPLHKNFYAKLCKMVSFIDWCMINSKDMIAIGDHDAGQVTFAGLPHIVNVNQECLQGLVHFNKFGLSIYRDKHWHVSLRHHAYNAKQPSGHFHNDVASMTLAINSVPVIVDPGSYVYTASGPWRNYFRSAGAHNHMYIKDREPIAFDARLFALVLPEHDCCIVDRSQKVLQTVDGLYESYGLHLYRNIKIDKNIVFVQERVSLLDNIDKDVKLYIGFTFNHDVVLQHTHGSWIGYYKECPFFSFQSTLNFIETDAYVSPSYGLKKTAKRLLAPICLQDSTHVSTFPFFQDVKSMV